MEIKENTLFEQLFNASSDAQIIFQKNKVVSFNASSLMLFRISDASALLDTLPFDWSPEFQPNGEKSSVMAENFLREAQRLGSARFEWLHLIGTDEIWTEYSIDRLESGKSNCLLAIVREIGDFKRRQISTELRIGRLISQNNALVELSGLENNPDFKLSTFKEKLLEIALNTLEVDHVSIWWKRGNKLKKDVAVSADKSAFDLGQSISFGTYPRFDRVLIEHQLAVINDSFKDPRSNEFKTKLKAGFGSGSLMYVTVVSGNEFLGFIWIEKAGSVRKWEFEEQSFAVSIGEMLAKQVGSIQKRKVERKLEQSEQVFEALINHSMDVVCIINGKGQLTYQSPSFKNVLGFGPDELIGRKAFDYIHPNDLKQLKTKFLKLLSKPDHEDSFIYRAKHKNGQWVYVEALANNLLHQSAIEGIVVNIRDISERMRFQEQLQEQELYYRTLIEKSLEVTVVRDKNGSITYVSPSVDLVFGLQEKDLLGKKEFASTHPDDEENFKSDWEYLIGHPEKPIKLDQRIMLPNGKVRYIEGMVRNLLNVKPVNGMVMNFRDVTTRKKAESGLIESQMRLEGIISSAMDAIITVDSTQKIILFNIAAEKMFKQNAFDVFGHHIEILIPKEARKTHRKYVNSFKNSSSDKQKMGASKKQLYGLRSDGTLFPIDASISKQVIDEEIFFTAVIRDITEQLKSEQVLKEYNKTLEGEVEGRTLLLNRKNNELNTTLEELRNTQEQLVESEKMASLGQLTAGIAHEINNPINFVTSTINPLKRDIKVIQEYLEKSHENGENVIPKMSKNELTFLFEEIGQLLEGIDEGAKRTKNIVIGLRNFSRLDEESFKKVNLHDGLDSTLMLLNSKIKGKIEVLKNYGNIPMVECLPGKINQVFMNIISNAVHAIDEKGSIWITTSVENKQVKIAIRDSGHGMKKEVIKRIFEPFYTTKDVGIGTGLGLSISYGIIEKHGGEIVVKSEVGKGSTFVISLPVSQL